MEEPVKEVAVEDPVKELQRMMAQEEATVEEMEEEFEKVEVRKIGMEQAQQEMEQERLAPAVAVLAEAVEVRSPGSLALEQLQDLEDPHRLCWTLVEQKEDLEHHHHHFRCWCLRRRCHCFLRFLCWG